MNLLKYEKFHWKSGLEYVAGIDEAGRGPLAGPVVAASVILHKDFDVKDINDSKKISHKKRLILYNYIIDNALDVSIGIVSEQEIDELNILKATFLAMKRSINNLLLKPEQLLIDGPHTDIKSFPVKNIISGDSKSASIAAASIIAKVTRDQIMLDYDKIFPEYGFSSNKGYGTKKHIESLRIKKATPIHRKSFKIVKDYLPSFSFYKNNSDFDILGYQYIGSQYIRKQYKLLDIKINIEKNDDIIDFLFCKNKKYFFVKIITLYNNMKFSIGNISECNKDLYNIELEKILLKKEYNVNFSFNVIFVEFKENHKPKIVKE
ncbi:MAG: ribonuclease HII [Candidatus Marinimicrobia bacterium]|nr:ribonuclease HII [Candidatus Neomarinimicrobiota bacterium]|tara:strand:+ start:521 stop:1480 length:960 start_codon:yes stop_codon:yes gene_type:complete